jgi:hypothetical protein
MRDKAESLYEIKSGEIDIPDDSMARKEGKARLISPDYESDYVCGVGDADQVK